jgi:hypothetical protein
VTDCVETFLPKLRSGYVALANVFCVGGGKLADPDRGTTPTSESHTNIDLCLFLFRAFKYSLNQGHMLIFSERADADLNIPIKFQTNTADW